MMLVAAVLVVASILVHYEIMRLTADYLLPRISIVPRRAHVVLGICACFVAHTLEVWLFAGVYYFLAIETDSGLPTRAAAPFSTISTSRPRPIPRSASAMPGC